MNTSDTTMQLFRGAVYTNFTDPGRSRMSPLHAIGERATLFQDWQKHTISNQNSQKLSPEFVRHWVAADVTAFRNLASDQEQSATKSLNKNVSASHEYAEILRSVDANLYERLDQIRQAEKRSAKQAATGPDVGSPEAPRGISLPDDTPDDLKRLARDLPIDWTGKISAENARKESEGKIALYAERKGHVLPMWVTNAGSRDEVKELLAQYAEIAKRWVLPVKLTVNGFASDLPPPRAHLDSDSSPATASPGDKPAAPSPIDSAAAISKVLENATYKARSDGSVLYSINNRAAFVDHGPQILMEPKADEDEDSILAAVLLAKEKYRGAFEITGTDEFKSRAIAIMVKHGVEADLKNPHQATLYRELSLKKASVDETVADPKTTPSPIAAKAAALSTSLSSPPPAPSSNVTATPVARLSGDTPAIRSSTAAVEATPPGDAARATLPNSDSKNVDAIVLRMENGLNRKQPHSAAELHAWVKSDVNALAQIIDPKRQEFATHVMASVAKEKPDYLVALLSAAPEIGQQVETAEARRQLELAAVHPGVAQSIVSAERAKVVNDTGLKGIIGFDEDKDQAGVEANATRTLAASQEQRTDTSAPATPPRETSEQYTRNEAMARKGAELLESATSTSFNAAYNENWESAAAQRDRAEENEAKAYKFLAAVELERAKAIVAEIGSRSLDPKVKDKLWIDVKRHRAEREANTVLAQFAAPREPSEQYNREEAIAREGAKLLESAINNSRDATYNENWESAKAQRDRAAEDKAKAYKLLAAVELDLAKAIVAEVAEAGSRSVDPMVKDTLTIDVARYRVQREAYNAVTQFAAPQEISEEYTRDEAVPKEGAKLLQSAQSTSLDAQADKAQADSNQLVSPVTPTQAAKLSSGMPVAIAGTDLSPDEFSRNLQIDDLNVRSMQTRFEINTKIVDTMSEVAVKKWVDSDVDGLSQITLKVVQDAAANMISLSACKPKYAEILRRDYPALTQQLATHVGKAHLSPITPSVAAEVKGIAGLAEAGQLETSVKQPPASNLIAVDAKEWWHVQRSAVHSWAKTRGELLADLVQLGPEPENNDTFWFDQSGRPCGPPADAHLYLSAKRQTRHGPPFVPTEELRIRAAMGTTDRAATEVDFKSKDFVMTLTNDSSAVEPKLVLRGVKKLENGDYDTTVLLFKGKGDYLQGFVKIGNEKHQVLAHLNSRNPDPGTGEVRPNFLKLSEAISTGEDTKWKEIGFGNAVNRRKDGKPVFLDEVLLSIGNEVLRARVGKNVDADLHRQLGFVDDRKPRPIESANDAAKDTSPKNQAPAAKQKAGAAGAKELAHELDAQPVPIGEADSPSKPARSRARAKA